MLSCQFLCSKVIFTYFTVDDWTCFLLKGTGKPCYSKSKPVLKCNLYLNPKLYSLLSHTQRTYTGVSALWATYQTRSVWKYRFPFSPNKLPMVSASPQNALQVLHHHSKNSKWDLVQNAGSHIQVNRQAILTKGLPALQGVSQCDTACPARVLYSWQPRHIWDSKPGVNTLLPGEILCVFHSLAGCPLLLSQPLRYFKTKDRSGLSGWWSPREQINKLGKQQRKGS